MTTFNTHPLRQRLNDEAHARPPMPLDAPSLVSFLAFLHDPTDPDADRRHLGELYERIGMPLAPSPDAAHLVIDPPAFA